MNSWDWLDAIIQEHRKANILCLVSTEAEKEHAKSAVIAFERRFANMLEGFENPVDPTSQPSLHRLLEISLQVSEKAEVFRAEYLHPYIRAIRDWAAILDTDQSAIAVWSAHGKIQRERRGKNG